MRPFDWYVPITIFLFASLMELNLNLMEKLRLFAEGDQSKLSESFLLAGLTFLGKIDCSNLL